MLDQEKFLLWLIHKLMKIDLNQHQFRYKFIHFRPIICVYHYFRQKLGRIVFTLRIEIYQLMVSDHYDYLSLTRLLTKMMNVNDREQNKNLI